MRIGTARLRVVVAMGATLFAVAAGARAQAPAGWKAVVRIRPNPIPVGRCTNMEIEVQDPDGFRTGLLSNGQAMNQRQFSFTSSNTTSFSWRGDPTDGVICATAGTPPATTTIRIALPDGVIGEVQLTSVSPGTSATPVIYPPQARLRPPGFVSRAPVAATVAARGTNTPTVSATAVGTAPSTTVSGATTGGAAATPADGSPALLPTSHSIAAPAKTSPVGAKAFVPATVAVTSPQIVAVGPYFTPSIIAVTASPIQAVGATFTPTGIAVTAPSLTAIGPYFVPALPAIVTAPISAVGPTP